MGRSLATVSVAAMTLPLGRGRGVEVDVQGVTGLVVESVGMQGVTFVARSRAAGEAAVEHVLFVFVLHAASDRHHVTGPAVGRVLGGQDVIEQGSFVEVGIGRVRIQGKESAG